MAYNPINTREADGTAAAAGQFGQGAPDSVRAAMYSSAGIPEFFGVNVMEIHELGASKKFTSILAALSGSKRTVKRLVVRGPNGAILHLHSQASI